MNQVRSCSLQGGEIHGKAGHDRIVSVKAQSFIVADRYQKQIQGRRRVAALFDIPVMDQSMIQPAELFGYGPDSSGGNRLFGYHDVLLCQLWVDW